MQFYSVLLTAPVAIAFGDPNLVDIFSFRTSSLLVIHSLSTSVIAVLLWYGGMRQTPASVAGIFAGFLPITAGVLGIVVLNETFTIADLTGFVLLFLSILLAAVP